MSRIVQTLNFRDSDNVTNTFVFVIVLPFDSGIVESAANKQLRGSTQLAFAPSAGAKAKASLSYQETISD